MRTATEIQADLTAAYAARRNCLIAQSVGGDGATRTMASLAEISRLIAELEAELAAVNGTGSLTFTPTMGMAAT